MGHNIYPTHQVPTVCLVFYMQSREPRYPAPYQTWSGPSYRAESQGSEWVSQLGRWQDLNLEFTQASVPGWLHAFLEGAVEGWVQRWPRAPASGVVQLFTSQGDRTNVGSYVEGAHLDSRNLSGCSGPGEGCLGGSRVGCLVVLARKTQYWADSEGCPRTVMSPRPPWNRWAGS